MAFDQVAAQFSAATNFASAATSRAESFITSLNTVAGALEPPELQVDAEWPPAPALTPPGTHSVSAPSTAFPTFNAGSAPVSPGVGGTDVVAPEAPVLTSLVYTPGAEPSKPVMDALSAITLPSGLEGWTPPAAPALMSVSVAPFGGIDLHTDWLNRLDTAPDDLTLLAPEAFVDPNPTKYTSGLLEDMISLLRARVAGGTGLPADVEEAIWDRGRAREAQAAQAHIDEVTRNFEASGFSLPSGAFHAQLREAQKTLLDKSVELSRDIAIKQAELEQANARHAIEQGIALEGRLVEYANNIEQRTLDAAKSVAANAIEIFNAQVGQFRALVEKYTSFAGVYKTLIDAEQSKVEAYKATVDAERAKADINKTLLDQTRLEIDFRNSRIAAYRAELEAVQALVGVDKLKVESFGEQIKAYVAQLNAEVTKVEVVKAHAQGNVAIAEAYRSQTSAYASKVGADAEISRSRANIYASEVQAYLAKVQAYSAHVQGEAEKTRALVSIEGLKIDAAKLEVQQNTSNNELQIGHYQALLGYYDKAKQVALQQAKVLSDNYFALKTIVTEAAKVGAQVNAQMAASAYGTLHAGASISGNDSTSTQFNYSGDTSDTRAAPNY